MEKKSNEIKLNIIEKSDYILILVLDPINGVQIENFSKNISSICKNNDKHVVLDFTNIDYLFSCAISVLVGFYKILKKKDKHLIVINATDTVKSIFESVNITDYISVLQTFEEFSSWCSLIEKNKTDIEFRTENNEEDITIITLSGEFVSTNSFGLTNSLNNSIYLISKGAIIDLSSVESMDSSSIASLITFNQKLKQDKKKLVLVSINEIILDVLQIMNIDKFFCICENLEAGLKEI